jgi:hypothetical protein
MNQNNNRINNKKHLNLNNHNGPLITPPERRLLELK